MAEGSFGLDLERLRRLAERPSLFAPHEAPFWDDPHISKGMLAAHLDPEWDSASRPHRVIDREVGWIVGQLRLPAGASVLDLGCGPGLYCERLHARGLRVTGVDLSPRSIAHARQSAADKSLAIEYVLADYTSLDLEGEFDAALIINLDFAVLPDGPRDRLPRRRPAGAQARRRVRLRRPDEARPPRRRRALGDRGVGLLQRRALHRADQGVRVPRGERRLPADTHHRRLGRDPGVPDLEPQLHRRVDHLGARGAGTRRRVRLGGPDRAAVHARG